MINHNRVSDSKEPPIILLLTPIVLLVIATVILGLVYFRVITPGSLSSICGGGKNEGYSAAETASTETPELSDSSEMQESDESVVSIDINELCKTTDELVAQSEEAFRNQAYEEGTTGMETALLQYSEIAGQYEIQNELQERISSCYTSYCNAVLSHVDSLKNGELSGASYLQAQKELDDALEFSKRLEEYPINMDSLREKASSIKSEYTYLYIVSFNRFTQADTWPAEEALQLMESAKDSLFRTQDINDPLRLRYAYALAFHVRYELQMGVSNKSMTTSDAINGILNVFSETDYNPVLLCDMITYMKLSGMDTSKYDRILAKTTEFIVAGGCPEFLLSVPLEKYWYFNDLRPEYSEGIPSWETNGLSVEARQNIRMLYAPQ